MPSPEVIAAGVVLAVLAIGVARLLTRPRRPQSNAFRCARCGANTRHSPRSELAWRNGAKRLFCDSCHQLWLSAQPSGPRSRAGPGIAASNRGCLGVAVLLAACPLALLVALICA